MGQKTHPYGFRLVYNKTWHSRWYAQGKTYSDLLHQDLKLREDLKRRLGHAGVAAIDIERAADKLRVTIHTSRPGIIIGRKGAEVDKLRDDLIRQTGREVHINIQEIQRPELDAQLVSESIAGQLERIENALVPVGGPALVHDLRLDLRNEVLRLLVDDAEEIALPCRQVGVVLGDERQEILVRRKRHLVEIGRRVGNRLVDAPEGVRSWLRRFQQALLVLRACQLPNRQIAAALE